jgi:hypothetical protein
MALGSADAVDERLTMRVLPVASSRAASLDRPVATALAAWVAMLGVDVLLHGGLLAPLYDWAGGFLLSPQEAFVRIPAGYLAFLVLAAVLVWLLPNLGIRNAAEGARIASLGGGAVWGALLLGMWSITAADPVLLMGWWVGQTVQLAIAGYLIGSRIAGTSLRAVAWSAIGVLVVALVVAVVLQSSGYAAAPVRLN